MILVDFLIRPTSYLPFSCFMILTLVELLGGLFIEKFFGVFFWDYTKYRFNVGKYISLEMSLLWVLASVLFVFVLRPFLDYIIDKLPNFFFYVMSFLFVGDISVISAADNRRDK